MYGDSPRGGLQVVARSRRAAAKGVTPGTPLAEAKGILQQAENEDRKAVPLFYRYNSQADLTALRQLAASCRCFSPQTGIEESESPECLLLDITGCEHLFGGEDDLAKQLAQQLDQQGYVARLAIANTVGAAWALAHYHASEDLKSIASLPVKALRLPTRVLQTLHELDIRRIEQLQALPRQTLASRFGDEVARRLDQAIGEIEELIIPVRLPEPIEAAYSFEEPVANRDALQMVVRQLLDKITRQLESSQQDVRSLLVHLSSGKAQGTSFTVGLVQPRASARHLFELIAMKFDRLTLTSPVTGVLLRATITTPLLKQQHNILGDQQTQQSQQLLAALLERMSSRLGERAVVRPKRYPDAQPEHAFRLEAVVGRGQKSEVRSQQEKKHAGLWPLTSDLFSSRPLRFEPTLIPIRVISVTSNGPPVRFYWRDQDHRIARYWGPERIEAGWWRERNALRDYYRVETESSQQFWVYRCLRTRCWFLQGAFE